MPRILSFTRVALLLAVFVLFTLMNAPLGVVAYHDNEAEHGQAAVSVGGEYKDLTERVSTRLLTNLIVTLWVYKQLLRVTVG
jgi:hypothetical protein